MLKSKHAEKHLLAHTYKKKGKLYLGTKQKQKLDMQQGSDSTNYLAWLVTDKECKNNLPTFIDIEKYFF